MSVLLLRLKPHIPYVAALLVLVVVFLNTWLAGLNSHTLGDVITYYYPRAVALQESMLRYGDFVPLWQPYIFSGDPFLGKPNVMNAFFLLGPLLLFFSPMAALHLNVVLATFFSGLFMYVLVNYLCGDRKAAFVAALVYIFSGFYLTTVVFFGWVVFGNAFMLMPLLLLFLFMSFRGKSLLSPVAAGIALGFMVISGSGIEFLYASVVVGVFLFVHLLGNDFLRRLLKVAFVGFVVVAVCFGVSAFKLLPVLEYQGTSVRSSLGWEEASGRVLPVSRFFSDLVEPEVNRLFFNTATNKLGIVALLLAGFAVFRRPFSRLSVVFVLVCVVALLLASGSFLLYLFWKFYPGWGGMRYANRAVIMLVPAVSVLAGIGAAEIFSFLKARFNLSSFRMRLVFFGVVALVLVDLVVLGSGGQSNIGDERYKYRDIDAVVGSNQVLQHLGRLRQSEVFRIHAIETTGIDWGTEFYTAPLGLENIYGYDTQWSPAYFNGYLSAAFRSPAKLWGILNVKYVTSQSPFNVSGFSFVQRFGDCSVCFPEEPAIQKAWGPYLYVNERFLPRARLVESAVLVVGEQGAVRDIVFSLLLHPGFDPAKALIVSGRGDVDSYSVEELSRYRAVVLAQGSVSQSSSALLAAYRDRGGVLIPDLVSGKSSASESDVSAMLAGLSGSSSSELPFFREGFSRVSVDAGNSSGFLVLSERFSSYPGWSAVGSGSGKRYELLKAYEVVTAVYLDGMSEKVAFSYLPRSFVLGSLVSLVTFVLLAVFFVWLFLSKQKGSAQASVML